MITIASLVLFIASLIVAVAAVVVWGRRAISGGKALSFMFIAIAVWCFFSALETTSTTEAQRMLRAALSYLGVCSVAPLFFMFACQYSDSHWRLHNWVMLLIWSVPVATLLLAFTNGWHHLIWTGVSPSGLPGANTVIYHHGPWYTLATLWFLALCLLASWHLVRVALRAARPYVLHSVLLLGSVAAPWVGFLLFILPGNIAGGLETTCLGFTVSAVLILLAIGRFRFLDLVPQARATLMENMHEGFLVLDLKDRIVDINRAARTLCGLEGVSVGGSLQEALPLLGRSVGAASGQTFIVQSPVSGTERTLEVSVSPLLSQQGRRTGRLLLMRDITERRRAESEREKLIGELRDALANVRSLRGLLPICASCKKIRNDQGYWQGVESYMRAHAEVQFSHGICPECAQKMYPELMEEESEPPR
jgi:PAS domain-containing protein